MSGSPKSKDGGQGKRLFKNQRSNFTEERPGNTRWVPGHAERKARLGPGRQLECSADGGSPG